MAPSSKRAPVPSSAIMAIRTPSPATRSAVTVPVPGGRLTWIGGGGARADTPTPGLTADLSRDPQLVFAIPADRGEAAPSEPGGQVARSRFRVVLRRGGQVADVDRVRRSRDPGEVPLIGRDGQGTQRDLAGSRLAGHG